MYFTKEHKVVKNQKISVQKVSFFFPANCVVYHIQNK